MRTNITIPLLFQQESPQPRAAIAPVYRPDPFSSVGQVYGPLRGEESDAYQPVIAVLNAHWRVIACQPSAQWILQKRRGGIDSWRGVWFCRTREALIRGARERADLIGGQALVILLRLPEHFPETTQ